MLSATVSMSRAKFGDAVGAGVGHLALGALRRFSISASVRSTLSFICAFSAASASMTEWTSRSGAPSRPTSGAPASVCGAAAVSGDGSAFGFGSVMALCNSR
jgi:hypothetical protein